MTCHSEGRARATVTGTDVLASGVTVGAARAQRAKAAAGPAGLLIPVLSR